jgi:formiminotetrahydrofolate cyclodeaminase
MRLSERPLADLLAAFRAPSPTPGGGSAAALASAVGASLLAMVASMPKHRAASEEDVDRLHRATDRCTQLSERLAGLVDEDSGAYDQVVAAYQLPRGSEAEKAERGARIQDALKAAIEAPLEVMRRCAEAIQVASVVAAFGNSNAASDVGVALELLGAGARGARLNVEINLPGLKDAQLADRVRDESSRLASEIDPGITAARARLA